MSTSEMQSSSESTTTAVLKQNRIKFGSIPGLKMIFSTGEVNSLKRLVECLSNIVYEGNLIFLPTVYDKNTGIITDQGSILIRVKSQRCSIYATLTSQIYECHSKRPIVFGVDFSNLLCALNNASRHNDIITFMLTDKTTSTTGIPYMQVTIESCDEKKQTKKQFYKIIGIMLSLEDFPKLPSNYSFIVKIKSSELIKFIRNIPKSNKLIQFMVGADSYDEEQKTCKVKLFIRVSGQSLIDNSDCTLMLPFLSSKKVLPIDKLDQYSLKTVSFLLKACTDSEVTFYIQNETDLVVKMIFHGLGTMHAMVTCDDIKSPVSLSDINEQDNVYDMVSNIIANDNKTLSVEKKETDEFNETVYDELEQQSDYKNDAVDNYYDDEQSNTDQINFKSITQEHDNVDSNTEVTRLTNIKEKTTKRKTNANATHTKRQKTSNGKKKPIATIQNYDDDDDDLMVTDDNVKKRKQRTNTTMVESDYSDDDDISDTGSVNSDAADSTNTSTAAVGGNGNGNSNWFNNNNNEGFIDYSDVDNYSEVVHPSKTKKINPTKLKKTPDINVSKPVKANGSFKRPVSGSTKKALSTKPTQLDQSSTSLTQLSENSNRTTANPINPAIDLFRRGVTFKDRPVNPLHVLDSTVVDEPLLAPVEIMGMTVKD